MSNLFSRLNSSPFFLFLLFTILTISTCFVVLFPTPTSALSISWSSSSIDFGSKTGLSGAQYTVTASASISGATYGFTSAIDSSSDTCLRHSTKATEQCSSVSANYKIPLTNSTSPTNSNNSTATLTLTSKATTSVSNMAGEYSGAIVVTVLAKDPPPPPCQGGTCATNYGYMQNFTTTQCNQMSNYDTTIGEITYTTSSSYTPNNTLGGVNTVYLTDSRNSQQYRIRKMQDGKCWMIDSLKIYNKTLTSADSDIVSGSFTLPTTLNTTNSSVDNAVRIDDPENGPYVNIGNTTKTYCSNGSGGIGTVKNVFPDTITGCGYLYNWYTATAGKGASGLVNTTVDDSICPKNWNLPTSGSGGQFEALNDAISLVAGGGQSWQGVYSGDLSSASGFNYQGEYGTYWSSMAYSTAVYTYILSFNSSSTTPSIYSYKYIGRAIRCIL